MDTFYIIIAILALEMALKNFGAQVQHGKGVAAAQEILLEAYSEETPDISGHHYLELTNESSCV